MDVKQEIAPSVSILVVNWNGIRHLRPLFESIGKIDFDKKKFEVLMVDNASTDDSVSFTTKNFPWVRVIQLDKNYGFCGGNNRGINEARGEYVLLLNNDVVVDKDLLGALLKGFSSPLVAAVGGKVYQWNDQNPAFNRNNVISSSWPKISPWRAIPFNFTDERPTSPVDYLPGCVIMVKKNVIEEVGFLDEEYVAYFEETDWCARMIRAGYTVSYVPEAMVWHRVGATGAELSNDFNHRMMVRNRIRFVLKNFDLLNVLFFFLYYPFEVLWKFFRLNLLIVTSLYSNSQQRAHAILSITYYSSDLKFVFQSIYWNIIHITSTILARWRDFKRIKNRRSYNWNLPLSNIDPNRRDL